MHILCQSNIIIIIVVIIFHMCLLLKTMQFYISDHTDIEQIRRTKKNSEKNNIYFNGSFGWCAYNVFVKYTLYVHVPFRIKIDIFLRFENLVRQFHPSASEDIRFHFVHFRCFFFSGQFYVLKIAYCGDLQLLDVIRQTVFPLFANNLIFAGLKCYSSFYSTGRWHLFAP